MALTFPLSFASFFGTLSVLSERMAPLAQNSQSGLEGGEILTAEVAPQLWGGSIALNNMNYTEAGRVSALLSALEVPGRAFYASSGRRSGPQSDPNGTVIGGASPNLNNVDSSGRVRFANLPSSFVLSPGDLFGFTYGSSPTRYALHQVVSGGTASGGTSPYLDVVPPIRPGWLGGAAVSFVNPVCRAVVVPGSVDLGSATAGRVTGAGFEWRQTLG